MPSNHIETDIVIKKTCDPSDLSICATMLSSSDPWITLSIGYDSSLLTISDPSREVYVAHLDGFILGLIVIEMKGAFTGYIKSICVSPDHRGEGVGSLLMAYAEDRIFRERPNVFLCVSSFNTGAQRFYQQLGYSVLGELKDYLVSGYSELLLRKTIAPINEFRME